MDSQATLKGLHARIDRGDEQLAVCFTCDQQVLGCRPLRLFFKEHQFIRVSRLPPGQHLLQVTVRENDRALAHSSSSFKTEDGVCTGQQSLLDSLSTMVDEKRCAGVLSPNRTFTFHIQDCTNAAVPPEGEVDVAMDTAHHVNEVPRVLQPVLEALQRSPLHTESPEDACVLLPRCQVPPVSGKGDDRDASVRAKQISVFYDEEGC